MSRKKKNIVYSTNTNFNYEYDGDKEQATLPPNDQTLYVHFEKKHRAGKKVTLVERFVGTELDLKNLASLLKKKCGVGGSAKDGIAIIQGDHCDKVKEILRGEGYEVKG
ncbi:MAG TPA: translation initiation factor [Flavobacteriales bacterium]|jgi:translation initiation factor 1|nr:translation initiation factor [Flavobacteriales bacterium]HIO67768.1 translation initiation factor [Flavobacteriales bacterium]